MACEAELPFVVDEAIYAASECKSCNEEIPIGSIQFGIRTQSAGDGEDDKDNWYHLSCFFEKYQPKSISDIDGFHFLSRRDREEIEARIDGAKGSSSPSSSGFSSLHSIASSIPDTTSDMINDKRETKYSSLEEQSDQSLDELFGEKLHLSNQSSEVHDEDELDYILGLEEESGMGTDDELMSKGKGRGNIRRIMEMHDLDSKTRKVIKEEEARRKRVAERQELHPHIYQVEYLTDKTVKKLVLDYDAKSGEELVTVDPKLLKKLKLHQMRGVRFMWDACFESLEQANGGKGGGCILAHCMGLGKTLQVITLLHTLLRHPETKVKKILIICPLSTVLNWKAEFEKWLEDLEDWHRIEANIFEMTKSRNNVQRAKQLQCWDKRGGVMILGYDSFRSLVNSRKMEKHLKKQIEKALLNPGPQLVICDEGHLLKNEKTALAKAAMKIKTLRRIALTGTPLQNNLMEYYCMVQFVKPYLLGHREEFRNQFVNPIEDGQFNDSTAMAVKRMKERALVLHEMLEGIIQRFDYDSVLRPLLPPKSEFVILTGLSDVQASLYESYIETRSECKLFQDYSYMRLIWTHPLVLKFSANQRLKNQKQEETADESISPSFAKTPFDDWWPDLVPEAALEDYKQGPKLVLLFAVLKQCEKMGDKLLIFSQSIPTLDMIEHFLSQSELGLIDSSVGVWHKNVDYFRLDGQTKNELRSKYCKIFNRSDNTRARLFLISTKAGGLGINLTAANRVIIFDASWNPSSDIQSIFRVCRVGQKKPCFIYRFLAQGTMEEKIYDRQVTKLSVSCRVVDDQQVNRHFSQKDIDELYEFNRKPPLSESDEVPELPSDPVMAELLEEYKNVIISYHEHDSLLENIVGEKLTEAERRAAWKDYQEVRSRQPKTKDTTKSESAMSTTTTALANAVLDDPVILIT